MHFRRTLGTYLAHLFSSFRLDPRPLRQEASGTEMVAAFGPLIHYPLFRNDATQVQVARNKRLRTNLLDTIRFGCARLKSGTGAGVSPFFLHAIALHSRPRGATTCGLAVSIEDSGFHVPLIRLVRKLRPPLMPDAAPPVNRFRRSLSRSNNHAAVLTSSYCFRHFNSGFLLVLFLSHTRPGLAGPFPFVLTTKAFDDSRRRWFGPLLQAGPRAYPHRISSYALLGLVIFCARGDRKSTRLNSSHLRRSRMPSSA